MPSFELMFVPGAAGLGSFWDPVRHALPSAWRVRAVDWPGMGATPPREDVQRTARNPPAPFHWQALRCHGICP